MGALMRHGHDDANLPSVSVFLKSGYEGLMPDFVLVVMRILSVYFALEGLLITASSILKAPDMFRTGSPGSVPAVVLWLAGARSWTVMALRRVATLAGAGSLCFLGTRRPHDRLRTVVRMDIPFLRGNTHRDRIRNRPLYLPELRPAKAGRKSRSQELRASDALSLVDTRISAGHT